MKFPKRIIAIGDIHAHREAFYDITFRMGIADAEGNWQAENTHLVMLGDICDRGYDSKTIYQSLIRWQAEAPDFNSVLSFVIGNHEVMNIFGYSMYNNPREIRRYAEKDSQSNGSREFRAAFSPGGFVYDWLLEQHCIIKIGPLVFAHADLPVEFHDRSIKEIDDFTMADIIESDPASMRSINDAPESLFSEDASIIWSRQAQAYEVIGYTRFLARFLESNTASAYICGHTPGLDGYYHLMHENRYLCIDTGITFETRGAGSRSALLVDEEGVSAYYLLPNRIETERLPLNLELDFA